MWHAAVVCDNSWHCKGMLAWGVSAGAISAGLILIFVLLMYFVPAVTEFVKFFALFLCLWWIAAVCSLTMPNDSDCDWDDYYCKGLFLDASNGFFGCWVAMIFAVILTCDQFGVSPGGGGDSTVGVGGGGGGAEPAKDSTYADSVAANDNTKDT